MSAFALIAHTFVLLAAAAPPEPTDDRAIAWACERKWEADGATASAIRYLTDAGRLREMYAEWQVTDSSGLVLSGFIGADDGSQPAAADWSAHIGWSTNDYDLWRFLPQLVLGPWQEGSTPPHAARPERTVSDLHMKWSEMRRHARGGRLEASLVDEKGRSHRNGVIDLGRVALAIAEARKTLDLSGQDARQHRSRCKPFDIPPVRPA